MANPQHNVVLILKASPKQTAAIEKLIPEYQAISSGTYFFKTPKLPADLDIEIRTLAQSGGVKLWAVIPLGRRVYCGGEFIALEDMNAFRPSASLLKTKKKTLA